MKKLLIGLLALSTVCAYAEEKIVSKKMVIAEEITSVSGCDKVVKTRSNEYDPDKYTTTLKIESIQDYKVYLVHQTIKKGVVKKEKLLDVEEIVKGKNTTTIENFSEKKQIYSSGNLDFINNVTSKCKLRARQLGFNL